MTFPGSPAPVAVAASGFSSRGAGTPLLRPPRGARGRRRPRGRTRRGRGRSTTASATSSWRGVVVVTASVAQPAARAAASPPGASSTTRQAPGSTPRRSAASRKGSGCGFPRSTSSAVTTTRGTCSPVAPMRTAASGAVQDVAMAQRSGPSAASASAAPASTVMPSVSASSSSVIRCSAVAWRSRRQQRGDDGGGRDAVEALEAARLDLVLLRPLQPAADDDRDGVDEGAVHVEDHRGEGAAVERAQERRHTARVGGPMWLRWAGEDARGARGAGVARARPTWCGSLLPSPWSSGASPGASRRPPCSRRRWRPSTTGPQLRLSINAEDVSQINSPTIFGNINLDFDGPGPAPGILAGVQVKPNITDLLAQPKVSIKALQPSRLELSNAARDAVIGLGLALRRRLAGRRPSSRSARMRRGGTARPPARRLAAAGAVLGLRLCGHGRQHLADLPAGPARRASRRPGSWARSSATRTCSRGSRRAPSRPRPT